MGILWAYNRDNGDMYMYNNIRVYIYIINYDLYVCIVYYVYIYIQYNHKYISCVCFLGTPGLRSGEVYIHGGQCGEMMNPIG